MSNERIDLEQDGYGLTIPDLCVELKRMYEREDELVKVLRSKDYLICNKCGRLGEDILYCDCCPFCEQGVDEAVIDRLCEKCKEEHKHKVFPYPEKKKVSE